MAKSAEEPGPQLANANVYVAGLPLNITLKRFRQLFSPFGAIIGARLIPRRKGYSPVGFVQYTSSETAQSAISAMNDAEVEGFRLAVTLAKRDKDKGVSNKPSTNLYVANLPKRVGEADLHVIFSRFGRVLSLRILRFQEVAGNRGTALVRFERVDDAVQAKEALHNLPLHGTELPLEVKYAETKEDRKSRIGQGVLAKKKKGRAEKADNIHELVAYVSGVVHQCEQFWDATVRNERHDRPRLPPVDLPAGFPPHSKEPKRLDVLLGSGFRPPEDDRSPPSSPRSHSSRSHSGNSGGDDPDFPGALQPGPSKLNPFAAPFVPRPPAHVGAPLAEPKELEPSPPLAEDLAARIVQMDAAQLAKLSTLLAGTWLDTPHDLPSLHFQM
eukprot:EG_transcript_9121